MSHYLTLDGNEAAARIAHRTSEVIAIYPITPASSMGELADAWSCAGRQNLFGAVPRVIEMQSEAGAAGVVHGALQAGSITTTFTASQGLLLMIPEMYKIAGELLPAVFHIAARTVATHALSIFGDHSDVMATRSCGWTMLSSASVQEAQDFALIAQMATLKSRIPVLHFFDGFRTSHEVAKIVALEDDEIQDLLDYEAIHRFRERALSPDHPEVRGTSQDPNVFFQSREAANLHYAAVPWIMQQAMNDFAAKTGRQYHLFDYVGDPAAEDVLVLMGSGSGAASEAIAKLRAEGRKVGMVLVRLFRPFDVDAFLRALPDATQRIAVLDRTKEPGAIGEPLYQDVVTALAAGWNAMPHREHLPLPNVIGGRYGLASKEFTPAMVAAVFAENLEALPRRQFTVGIYDDVTRLSLTVDTRFRTEPDDVTRAVFYGLGADGTVGASKNSVKIVADHTPLFAQGYFVYDSKKSGSTTVSHLRFSPRPITSTYLIDEATFIGVHQFPFVDKLDLLSIARPGATVLLNSPYSASETWNHLPLEMQLEILSKGLALHVVDAHRIAREAGLGNRINTIMQACFFGLSNFMPVSEAIAHIKDSIRKSYGSRGDEVVAKNCAAVDAALAGLQRVTLPDSPTTDRRRIAPAAEVHEEFIQRVTRHLLAGHGDLLPVSALPIDGSFPVGTAKHEKRSIAQEIPIWDADLCTECGLCSFVCPHSAIRMKVYRVGELNSPLRNGSPLKAKPWRDKERPDHLLTIQVAPDDCTGCGVCVDVCPAKSKTVADHKAIDMLPYREHAAVERTAFETFLKLPELDRTQVKHDTVKGSQLLQPLFEFSGACSGCGETPYLKLMTQLFGDRAMIANATGCSSIFGGNLPTTPWTTNAEGRGPAWCNSLFEDNAEFGLGMRLALDAQCDLAVALLKRLATVVGEDLCEALIAGRHESSESSLASQRQRVAQLKRTLTEVRHPDAARLAEVADALVPKSVWLIGGDGWAYDIGFGGLDHTLSTGANVNILVLDTGVYSNTGGQNSKATPRAAVAKFAAAGKPSRKKDLGLLAMAYGNVYVAQIAMGANPAHTVRVFREAESYPGPSLLLAYSHCIAHGIDMCEGMSHQKDVVQAGLWPLYRYDPRLSEAGEHPFQLDSRKPKLTFADFALQEGRFTSIQRQNPDRAAELFALAQRDIDDTWKRYEQLAAAE
ncbi:pyruvate:ferredoxin (flavodoxin) oxidoreductase [Lacipirellula limnantheis]|uniref:Pyruvate-flavodoxin oxidoreductase n=1 Tax=Lacipirellula limnantheis TaxID=2528024 RepID=A0A517U274_9BACT|nr:pyruvate:ferredoxin (flavodoxin) oxidoreductase [Lacipirellula limnantheis]QDT74710.1 Pyruvate-flavodoxin oxidoreductase [Lacipirellula limnantheis]